MTEFLFILTTLLAPLALVLFIAILRVKRGVDPFFGPDLIAIQVAVDCSVLADPAVVLPRIWHLAVANISQRYWCYASYWAWQRSS